MNKTWVSAAYISGTQVVQRKKIGHNEAYYHVGHLAADTEGDGGRFDVADELRDFLNGGPDPWWRSLGRREGPEAFVLPHGCEIRATGPMIDRAEPPSWGLWAEDDSSDAKIARGLLIDRLATRPACTKE